VYLSEPPSTPPAAPGWPPDAAGHDAGCCGQRCAVPLQNDSSRSSAGSSAPPFSTCDSSPRTAAKANRRADFGSTSRSTDTQFDRNWAESSVKRQASDFQWRRSASKPLIALSPEFESQRIWPQAACRDRETVHALVSNGGLRRDANFGQGLLAAAQRAEVRHRLVQVDQPQQALDKPGRLPQRHAEPSRGSARSGLKTVHRTVFRAPFTLHCQARLDRGIAVVRLSAPLSSRRSLPSHGGIEPDRQRSYS